MINTPLTPPTRRTEGEPRDTVERAARFLCSHGERVARRRADHRHDVVRCPYYTNQPRTIDAST